MELNVINKSPDKVTMEKEGIFYNFDYGIIPFESNSKIYVDIVEEKNNVKNLNIKSTCGCTVPSLVKEGNTHKIEIEYDTKRKGLFAKQLIVTYKKNLSSQKIIFNIKGQVV